MSQALIRKWANLVVTHRIYTLLLTLFVLGAFSIPATGLKFNNSNEMWFLENDPSIRDYEELRKLFDSNQSLVIGIEAQEKAPHLFNQETLRMIREITEFLEDQPMVTKVTSLANYQFMTSQDGVLKTNDLIEDIEEWKGTPKEQQNLLKIMSKEQLAIGNLITEDMRHTILNARVEYIPTTMEHHTELVNNVKKLIAQKGYSGQGFQFHFAGTSAANEAIYADSTRDRKTLQPIMIVLILVFLVWTFRTWAGFVMPIVVIVGSVIGFAGFIALLGWNLNILNTSLPILLMAVGIGDAVHILVEFYHFRNRGYSAQEASKKAIEVLFIPCFYTSLTTSIGFLAVAVTRLAPLREYGIGAAFGVTFAFLISVTTLPALLSFTREKASRSKRLLEEGWTARITQALPDFSYRYKWIIVLTSILFCAVSVKMALEIQTDSSYKKYFKKNSKIRQDLEYFDQHFRNSGGFAFIIDSGKKGGVKDPQFLEKVNQSQLFLQSIEDSGEIRTLVDYIHRINQVMNDDDPAYATIPSTRNAIAQYLLLYGNSGPNEDLSILKDFDERYLRINMPIIYRSSLKTVELIELFNQVLQEKFPDLEVIITGGLVLDSVKNDYIIEGLTRSFSIAIGIIVLCFFFLFRSIKYGLLALIPSIFPIIVAGSLMKILDIYLDFNTMIIAAMTFGIAVDDTIHIMTRYIRARRDGQERTRSVYLAVTESGRAVVFTSMILYCGFLLNLFASFVPAIHFAILGGTIILIACVADLIVLPAVILLTTRLPTSTNRPA